jgi:pyruvate ferredoxin oxidoreductase delta subunit
MSDQPKVYAPDAGWRDMAEGGIIPQAGNAVLYSVAGWRLEYPVRDNEACIDCLFCWAYCPDEAVLQVGGSVKGQPIDMEHCKGCTICARVCPKDCISMHPESERGEQGQGG